MTFRETCKAAREDETTRLLVRAIVAANKSGTPDRTAYLAFRDRVTEIGLSVPNAGYWPMLLASVAAKS